MTPSKEIWLVESPTAFWFSREPVHDLPDDCVVTHMVPAQPEQDKERCVGCEACIDTACGRDECPKGWPKAPQPEQEPVAWIRRHPNGALSNEVLIHVQVETARRESGAWVPLYTTPPQRTWVGLTDEEIEMIVENRRAAHWEFVRQVEALLKEKNT